MKRGGEDKLFQMIQKKHNKGKSMEQIAEELLGLMMAEAREEQNEDSDL